MDSSTLTKPHPEQKIGEKFVSNIPAKFRERYEETLQANNVNDLRIGKVAYYPNSSTVIEDFLPVFRKPE